MAGSVDDIPLDGMRIDEIERLKQAFDLDIHREKMLKAILLGVPIVGVGNKITEDYWLANILRDIEKGKGAIRSRALTMLGTYLGILTGKAKLGKKKRVVFDERMSNVE
jgi:hypothetical protein